VQIMDPAVAPPLPVFPDPALGVSALFFGGVLLALGALVPAKYCRDFWRVSPRFSPVSLLFP